LSALAEALSGALGCPVNDMTGLDGSYEIEVAASADELVGLHPPPAQILTTGPNSVGSNELARDPSPSLMDSIKVLGLQMEGRKVRIQFIVVDAINKVPTEN